MEHPNKEASDCPVAPPSHATVYSRTLHRACELLGGVQQLAIYLKCSARVLFQWIDGQEEPPITIFLAAVDLVLVYSDRTGPAHQHLPSAVYSRTIQKAAELAGGRKELARHLRVPLEEIEKWIAAEGTPPLDVFLRAVDLVLEETRGSGGASDPGEPPSSRDCAASEGRSEAFE